MMQNNEDLNMYGGYREPRTSRRDMRNSKTRGIQSKKVKSTNPLKFNFKLDLGFLKKGKQGKIGIIAIIILVVILGFGIKAIFFNNSQEKVKSIITSYLNDFKKSDDLAILNFSKTNLEKRIEKEENKLMTFKILKVEQADKINDSYTAQIEVENVDKSEVIRKTKQSLNDEKISLDNKNYEDEYVKRYIKYRDELKNSKQKRTYNLIIKKNKKDNTFYIQNASEVK